MGLMNKVLEAVKLAQAGAPGASVGNGWRLPPPYSTIAGEQAAAISGLLGPLAGYGGGTFNMDGSVATPVDPSQTPPTPPIAPRKRGGVLGALESVFMPEADSRWAAALRGGLFDAKANQQSYKQGVVTDELTRQTAEAKLKKMLRGGDYQIAGNNIVIDGPNGPEFRAPPPVPTDKQRLIDKWQDPNTPSDLKRLIEGILLGGNDDDVIRLKGEVAGTVAERRAASQERHRAPPRASGIPPLPPGFKVVQ